MKNILLLLLIAVCCQTTYAARQDTIHVYFATGTPVISPAVQDQLDGYIYNDRLHNGQALQIIGYADYTGGNKYNDRLSKQRAAAVKRFLINYGFREKDIVVCIGKGQINREKTNSEDGSPHDRRVDIVTNPEMPAALPPVPPPAPVSTKTIDVKQDGKTVAVNPANLKKNATLILDKIYFYPGRHEIRPESETSLNQLYEVLKENPNLKIGIEGHICCVNNAGDALDFDTREIALSANRAKFVYNYLIKKGINKERLSYKGLGATHRLTQESTEEEADKNRRVEIRIL